MKCNLKSILVLVILIGSIGCGGDDSNNVGTAPTSPNPDEWLIPVAQVLDGGPGKDGIPSIDNPQFSTIANTNSVGENELVVVAKLGDQVYAYPHEIMDWHEIVNHFTSDLSLSMTYCPLTGTAIGWDPLVNGELTQFGVSGLLYNSNLMPYDRKTNSTWSQMRGDCVNGLNINTIINTIHMVETKYSTFKTLYPEGMVLSEQTGFSRNYGQYPYGSYKTNTQLIFPINGELDNALHPKTRVLGIQHKGSSIAFPFDSFDGDLTKVISKNMGADEVLIIGSKSKDFIVAFLNDLNGAQISLSGTELLGESIAIDTNGNEYNVFGEVIRGPANGQKLKPIINYIGYWFAWNIFSPNIELIE